MTDHPQAGGNTRAVTIVVLLGASLMLTMSMGMRQSFGLFVTPITRDIGVSVGHFTFALAVQNIVWGMTQPLTGAIADRFGCRAVTVTGSLLYAAGLAVTMMATGPIALLIGMGLMIGLAMSCVSLSLALAASAKVVSPAKRSITLGSVSALGSIGSFIAAPLAQGLIVTYGWKFAIVGFLGLCVIMIPGAFLIGATDKKAPRPLPGAMDTEAGLSLKGALSEAAHHRGYITMAVAFFVCGLQLVFLTTHLPAYLALCGQSPNCPRPLSRSLADSTRSVATFLAGSVESCRSSTCSEACTSCDRCSSLPISCPRPRPPRP